MIKLLIAILLCLILGISIDTPQMYLKLEFMNYQLYANVLVWIACVLGCIFLYQLLSFPIRFWHRYRKHIQFKQEENKQKFLIKVIETYVNRNTLLYPKLLEQAKKTYKLNGSTYWTISALLSPSQQTYHHLCDFSETLLGGIYGLLKSANKEGDINTMQHLLNKLPTKDKKMPWVSKAYFQLSIQQGDWNSALSYLEQLKWVMKKEDYTIQRACCLYQNGQIKQAYSLAPQHPIIAIAWAKMNPKKMFKIIQQLWHKHPVWDAYLLIKEELNKLDATKQQNAIIKLTHRNPKHKLSLLALADIYLETKNPLKSKEFLDEYLESYPLTRQISLMMATIERQVWHHEEIARKWENKKPEAEDFTDWQCSICSHHTSTWHAVCPICHSFDSYQ